jgi:hypothetical protein
VLIFLTRQYFRDPNDPEFHVVKTMLLTPYSSYFRRQTLLTTLIANTQVMIAYFFGIVFSELKATHLVLLDGISPPVMLVAALAVGTLEWAYYSHMGLILTQLFKSGVVFLVDSVAGLGKILLPPPWGPPLNDPVQNLPGFYRLRYGIAAASILMCTAAFCGGAPAAALILGRFALTAIILLLPPTYHVGVVAF